VHAEAGMARPERGYRDPASLTGAQRAMQRSHGDAMAALAGSAMSDATLLDRLVAAAIPGRP
jgi:hypothetical protein